MTVSPLNVSLPLTSSVPETLKVPFSMASPPVRSIVPLSVTVPPLIEALVTVSVPPTVIVPVLVIAVPSSTVRLPLTSMPPELLTVSPDSTLPLPLALNVPELVSDPVSSVPSDRSIVPLLVIVPPLIDPPDPTVSVPVLLMLVLVRPETPRDIHLARRRDRLAAERIAAADVERAGNAQGAVLDGVTAGKVNRAAVGDGATADRGIGNRQRAANRDRPGAGDRSAIVDGKAPADIHAARVAHRLAGQHVAAAAGVECSGIGQRPSLKRAVGQVDRAAARDRAAADRPARPHRQRAGVADARTREAKNFP